MDTSTHNLATLFEQLGLPSSEEAIQSFVAEHHLPPETKISEADFWNATQAQFLAEALSDDSDWAEVVDELNALLRH